MSGVDRKWTDLGPFYCPPTRRNPFWQEFRRRTLYRAAVVAALLVVILGLRAWDAPPGLKVREGLRYILTTEWDYQPLVERVVALGLTAANVDLPFLGSIVGRATPALAPGHEEGLAVPTSGKVVRPFGWTRDALDDMERFHPGVDIGAPAGNPVRAVLPGRVARVGNDRALGPYLLLDHGEGTYSLYAQLQEITVLPGQEVTAGQTLARVGAVGDVAGGGLHFEFRKKGKLVDPFVFLRLER